MPRYIDADALKEAFDQTSAKTDGYYPNNVVDYIPSADVVEVVRCKDCKHATMTYDGLCKYCEAHPSEDALYYDGNYFCADGERGEEDEREK